MICIRYIYIIYIYMFPHYAVLMIQQLQGVGVLKLRDEGLSGTWLPKAQVEDLGRRTGRRLSKEASQQWAEVGTQT